MPRLNKHRKALIARAKLGHLTRQKNAEAKQTTSCDTEDSDKFRIYTPPQHVTASSIVAALKKQQKPISTVTDSSWNDDGLLAQLGLQSGVSVGVKDRVKVEASTNDEEGQGHQGDFLSSRIVPSCFVCRTDIGGEIGFRSLPSMKHYAFFMYEFLGIPIEEAKTYLEKLEKPDKWIKLCESCHVLVVKGKAVRQRITKLQSQLKQFKKTIVRKMKDTINIELTPKSATPGKSTEREALQMIQNFVSGKTYSGLNLEAETAQMTMKNKTTFSVVQKLSPGDDRPKKKSVHKVTIVKASTTSESGFAKSQFIHGHTQIGIPTIPSTSISVRIVRKINGTSIHGQKRIVDHSKKEASRKRSNLDSEMSISNTKKVALDLELPRNQDIDSQSKSVYKPSVYKYTCPHCPHIKRYSVVKYAVHLDSHLRMPYQCSQPRCFELFSASNPELWEQHWNEKHARKNISKDAKTFIQTKFDPGLIWKCDYCFQGFSTDMERNEHEMECFSNSADAPERRRKSLLLSYSCAVCSTSFRNFPEWRLHRAIHHPEKDRVCCYFCDKSFCEKTVEGVEARHDAKMLEHMVSAHAKNEYKNEILRDCPICGAVFPDTYKYHFLNNHGIPKLLESYRCQICYKNYAQSTTLRRHMTIYHFQSEASICDICGLKTERRAQLADHKMHTHGVDPTPEDGFKILTCPEEGCSYRSVQSVNFRAHTRNIHAKIRAFCKICKKTFRNSSKLKCHEEIHRNKESKPYLCHLCGNRFAVKNYLYIHKRLSHEGRIFPSTNKKKAPRKRTKANSENKTARTVDTQHDLEVGGGGEEGFQAHLEVGINRDLPVL